MNNNPKKPLGYYIGKTMAIIVWLAILLILTAFVSKGTWSIISWIWGL